MPRLGASRSNTISFPHLNFCIIVHITLLTLLLTRTLVIVTYITSSIDRAMSRSNNTSTANSAANTPIGRQVVLT